jgi:hypothetical protein
MATPIDPLPEKELCSYEKLRDDIIKEREKAMMECGFFDELNKTKKEFGLVSHIVEKEIDVNKKPKSNWKEKKKGKSDINPTKQKEMYGEDLMKNVMSFGLEQKHKSETKETAERKSDKEKDQRSVKPKSDEKEKSLFYQIDEWHLHDCLE